MRDHILTAALQCAERDHYRTMTRGDVAREAHCAPTLVTYYWPWQLMAGAVMRAAVARRCLRVIAQGLVDRHPAALRAPESLRRAALREVGRV